VGVREIHPIKFSLHNWDMLESYFLTGAGGCKGKYPVQNVPLHNWDILGGVTTFIAFQN